MICGKHRFGDGLDAYYASFWSLILTFLLFCRSYLLPGDALRHLVVGGVTEFYFLDFG